MTKILIFTQNNISKVELKNLTISLHTGPDDGADLQLTRSKELLS
jgi:hypothetical protein